MDGWGGGGVQQRSADTVRKTTGRKQRRVLLITLLTVTQRASNQEKLAPLPWICSWRSTVSDGFTVKFCLFLLRVCFDSHRGSKAAEIMTFLCDADAHQAYHCWLVHSPLKLPPSFKKYFLLLTHRCNDWQAVNSPRGEFAYRATSLTTSKVVGF